MTIRSIVALGLVATSCGAGSDGRDGPDADTDIDGDTDADSDVDGDSDSDPCEHPAEPVPCKGAPRPGGDMLDGEVCVPGGWFRMGLEDPPIGADDTDPARWVYESPLFMDAYPVTVERYTECSDEGVCPPPWDIAPCEEGSGGPCDPLEPNTPAYHFWSSARAFCEWDVRDGGAARLPTEAEYERAAYGLGCKPRSYPWGDEPATCAHVCAEYYDDNRVKGPDPPECDLGNRCPVDSRPLGASPDGLAALLGGHYTWTMDCYLGWYYRLALEHDESRDPVCDETSAVKECAECGPGHERTYRGVDGNPIAVPTYHLSARYRWAADVTESAAGFRCVRDAS